MEIRELRAFVAVAEEGTLSAAARRLHLSQSALTQTMQSLERQLGVQLLVRTHTGVTPTGPGETLLTEARALIEQHDRAVAAVTGTRAESLLRIGAPLELPADLLPAALARVDSRVEVTHASSRAQIEALRAGKIDIALVRDRPTDRTLDSVLAVEESMGVILAHDRAAELAGPRGVRLQDLTGMRWIGFPRSDSPAWHDQVSATLRGHGLVVENLGDRDDRPVTAEVKLATVAAGQTFAFASPGWLQPLPGGMTWSPLVGDPIVRRTWAVWVAASRRRDVAAFIAVIDISG
nr:LysR family transcriptional regulator [uncultured Actinoplanes sp.]